MALAAGGAEDDTTTHLLKVIFVGDSGVGKTCLLTRLCNNEFRPTTATVGVDTRFKRLRLDGKSLALTLWDTAGQERYRSIASTYYRGAQGVVYVFDVASRDSLDSLSSKWIPECTEFSTHPEAIRMVVGNKTDLEGEREVSPEQGAEFAREHGCLYRETSAKTDSGVTDALIWGLVCSIVKTPSLLTGGGAAGVQQQLGLKLGVAAAEGDGGGGAARRRFLRCCQQ